MKQIKNELLLKNYKISILFLVVAVFYMITPNQSFGSTLKLDLVGTSDRTATPTAPETVSWVRNIAVTDRYAYVVAPNEGVRIYDITNPGSPKLVSVIPYADPAWFQPMGSVGILRAKSAGVQVFDLTNPKEPKLIPFDNFRNLRFLNCGLAVLNIRTTVIDLCHNGEWGVRLFDFANPRAVKDLGTIHFDAGTATIYRNYLILGNYKEPSLKSVEIGVGGVRELETIPIDSDKGSVIPRAICAVGDRLYVIGERSYRPVFVTFSLEHFPAEIRAVGERETEKIRGLFGVQMTHDGRWLCLADGGRVTLFDLADPDKPTIAATLEGPFQSAAVRGDLVYASDARNVWIYRISRTQ